MTQRIEAAPSQTQWQEDMEGWTLTRDRAPYVETGGHVVTTLYRCPSCGSLVDRPWRCWHGESDVSGHDRLPVRVAVEAISEAESKNS